MRRKGDAYIPTLTPRTSLTMAYTDPLTWGKKYSLSTNCTNLPRSIAGPNEYVFCPSWEFKITPALPPNA
ncbi:MAG: hypothetical protein ACK4UP_02140 [Spirosomataceae bacterium]